MFILFLSLNFKFQKIVLIVLENLEKLAGKNKNCRYRILDIQLSGIPQLRPKDCEMMKREQEVQLEGTLRPDWLHVYFIENLQGHPPQ